MVGLPNVENTLDADKPVSTATQTSLNTKVNILDTASMLTPYLRKLDTASVSNRINLKVNIADTASMLMPYLRKRDTTSLSNRINLKVNIADTASMLMPYLRKRDTASLSNRINLKLNISDTAAMLLNYRNSGGSSGSGLPTTGNSLGNILYWNGSAWVRLTTGSEGQILKIKQGIPVWDNENFYCGLTTLSDIDNNIYTTVQIGTQCWMAQNLRVRKYNDGTNIPFDKSGAPNGSPTNQTWSTWNIGAHTIYRHDSTANTGNLAIYGYLYNWYAAAGIITAGASPTKNICPLGFKVPTEDDWATLISFVGGANSAGGVLKSQSSLWLSTNGATDSYGFSSLPGGSREMDGTFSNIRDYSIFWTSTVSRTNNNYAYRILISSQGAGVSLNDNPYQLGMSIRCLKQ
jgi:uncharacterized protein (TIGR02145 family)